MNIVPALASKRIKGKLVALERREEALKARQDLLGKLRADMSGYYEGVRAVLSADDLPKPVPRFGPACQDRPLLAVGTTQFHGEPVAIVAAELPGGKHTLFAFVSDDLIAQGLRADVLIREVAQLVGGKGGGRPHMAQAGIGEPEGVDSALGAGTGILRGLLDATS